MQNFSFFQRTIPLSSEKSKASLTIIFIFLCFLLSFVIACTLLFSQGFHKWSNSDSCNFTVEIPCNNYTGSQTHEQNTAEYNKKIHTVINFLESSEGVLNVKTVAPEKLKKMLASWVGEPNIDSGFRLPTLLDIKIDSRKNVNIQNLAMSLRNISADIRIEDNSALSQKLIVFGNSLKLITSTIGVFILFCLSIIVALVTKSSLQAYFETLDILRLMGAKDSYIAKIFVSQVAKSGLKGGFIGFILSVPTVYVLMVLLKYLGLDSVLLLGFFYKVICYVAIVPVLIIFISILISRFTVLSHLKKLDRCITVV